MSYLSYPRLHFSGTYKASPSTINNAPDNYDPQVYPSPNELTKVELYWNPKGNGGMDFMDDCVVTQVDYGPGKSTTDPKDDAIIGQPFRAIVSQSIPLQSALVDLDPMQQNTSEIWGMTIKIGSDSDNLSGRFPATSFTGIWVQCQGKDFPHSSASGSAVFQGNIQNVNAGGSGAKSPFLQYFHDHPDNILSINMNTNAHNNVPYVYIFTNKTFDKMNAAGVPQSVLDKMDLMKSLFMNYQTPENPSDPMLPKDPGNVPTWPFVKYMLGQLLSLEEFNTNIETIISVTKDTDYTGATDYDFLYGLVTGTVGYTSPSTNNPTLFVPSRMMIPSNGSPCFYAPFVVDDQNTLTVNLGNSLPTDTPVAGDKLLTSSLGELWLASFPSEGPPQKIVQIPYDQEVATTGSNPYKVMDSMTTNLFITQSAGIFSHQLDGDYSKTPLGIISFLDNRAKPVLQEDPTGRYLRADQFVYRMNPGIATTSSFPRGDTNKIQIYATRWGVPVSDNTTIQLTMLNEEEAQAYTINTLGTSGTLGVQKVSIPQNSLNYTKSAETKNGIATFDISCTDPDNPREFVDGQVYFLPYNFEDVPVLKDINDLVSVLVYNQKADPDAISLLAKFGRLYKIMDFLTSEKMIIDRRTIIKALIETPQTDLNHMPVTRDMSHAMRDTVLNWINDFNIS